nr:hypothetical protein [Tanacetum cinerariifolium]
ITIIPLVFTTASDSFSTTTPDTITTFSPPSPIRSLGYRAAMIRLRAEAASTSHSPPLPSPFILSPTRRPEVTLPPRKKLGIALGPGYEVGESSSAAASRPAGGLRADYDFVATMDREIIRDPERDLNMLFRDRRAHAYTHHLMETEARMSREAWVRSTDASDLVCGEDQLHAEDASPTTQSPEYVPKSDLEAHPEDDDDEDHEEDPVDYPADGGDDGDDKEGSSEDDEDDDMDIEADEEEEEEHPAHVDSVVVASTAADHAPSAKETEPFETDESAATPSLHPAYRMTVRISILAPIPMPAWSDLEVVRLLATSFPLASPLSPWSSPPPQIPFPPLPPILSPPSHVLS